MQELYIVMYHYVRNLKYNRFPGIKGLELSLFKKQIQFLKHNFHIVTMEEVIASYTNNNILPEKAVLLTFDDGYIDNYLNVFPILQEENLQGSFFVVGKTFAEHQLLDVNKIHFVLASANINNLVQNLYDELNYYRGKEFDIPSNEELFENYAKEDRFDSKETIFVKRLLQTILPEELRSNIASNLFQRYVGLSEEKFAYELYLNQNQIKCMKRAGMYIGIHGYSHNWLGNLKDEEIQKDIEKALEVMSDMINTNEWVMNYPYGSYNDVVIRYIKSKNCVLGLTTEVKVARIPIDYRYELPRLDTNDFPPKSQNYKELQK